MSNEYFAKTGNPQANSAGSSSLIRAEIASIESGFDKLPTLATNGGKIIAVNAGATALEAVTTTGTGSAVRATSPTLVTPVLGVATGTSFNSITGLSATLPVVAGTATIGVGTTAARHDHVHPVQSSVTGNAGTVTNATLTTALTVNTGTVTLSGNVANTSVVTIGAGAVSISGSNTGDNAVNTLYSGLVTNATHTGDVTGATALTIATNAVTNAKAAQMAVNTIKGRITAGTGNAEDLTAANVRTIINVADGANNYVHTTNANLTGEVTSVGNATTVLNATVIGKVLTGYVSGAGTVAATDSILQAVNKLNGNTAAKANTASPTFTGTVTLPAYTETVFVLSGTDIAPANGTVQTRTLAGNVTFTESIADGQSVVLMLNPATFTTTWPTISWVNAAGSGAAPTLKASVVNVIVLWQVAGTLYGNWIGSL